VCPLQPSEFIPLKRLQEKRYSKVLCYPKYDLEETKRRLKELKKLGVHALEFTGEKMAFDVKVLGKGYVGIVVAAYTDKGRVALKIRRIDADRFEMQHEAGMLRRANALHVGPTLLGATENFLLMEFVEGVLLPQWIETISGRGTRYRIRRVLRAVLEQCWRLDEAGLDHGELSRAHKHIIVDENDCPRLVDFETAGVNRRVSNVTSICHYLFIGSQAARTMKRKAGGVETKELINLLRNYKQDRTRKSFKKILGVCELDKADCCIVDMVDLGKNEAVSNPTLNLK
jgi:putative serine/threonine protein kinase